MGLVMVKMSKLDILKDELRSRLFRYRRDEDGAILIFGLIVFVIMLMVGGIAVDMMRYESERVRLQGTADRAVLAAAMMRDNPNNPNQPTPEDVLRSYFEAEGLAAYIEGEGRLFVDDGETSGFREVAVAPRANLNTTFMRLSGVDQLDMNLLAAASEGIVEQKIEIAMVLDVSGSMAFDAVNNVLIPQDEPRMDALHQAATDFATAMLTDNENGRVALSIAPYSTEVVMPPTTLSFFNNLSDPVSGNMTNAFCIDFDTWNSVTDSINAPMTRRNCDLRSNTDTLITDMPIRPFLNDVDDAVQYINTLWANWGTSIDLGVRTGALFLDPSINPIVDHLIDSNQVDSDYADHPLPWDDPTVFKALVLMTDGENCCYHVGDPATRKPSRAIQDADTIAVCDALKEQGVTIYAVAFEAPPGGVSLMEECASSVGGHFFNSSSDDLVNTFNAIATHIAVQSLRLTR